MTLGDFFDYLSKHPNYVLFYLIGLLLTAALLGFIAKGKGHLSPYKYIYSALIYMVCVPGIFVITLIFYLFLFERRSIFDLNLITEVLPVVTMIVVIAQIRRNVNLDAIPGFEKLSGLVMLISVLLILMWIVDRLRLVAFTFIPIQYVVLIFVVLLVVMRIGLKRLSR